MWLSCSQDDFRVVFNTVDEDSFGCHGVRSAAEGFGIGHKHTIMTVTPDPLLLVVHML